MLCSLGVLLSKLPSVMPSYNSLVIAGNSYASIFIWRPAYITTKMTSFRILGMLIEFANVILCGREENMTSVGTETDFATLASYTSISLLKVPLRLNGCVQSTKLGLFVVNTTLITSCYDLQSIILLSIPFGDACNDTLQSMNTTTYILSSGYYILYLLRHYSTASVVRIALTIIATDCLACDNEVLYDIYCSIVNLMAVVTIRYFDPGIVYIFHVKLLELVEHHSIWQALRVVAELQSVVGIFLDQVSLIFGKGHPIIFTREHEPRYRVLLLILLYTKGQAVHLPGNNNGYGFVCDSVSFFFYLIYRMVFSLYFWSFNMDIQKLIAALSYLLSGQLWQGNSYSWCRISSVLFSYATQISKMTRGCFHQYFQFMRGVYFPLNWYQGYTLCYDPGIVTLCAGNISGIRVYHDQGLQGVKLLDSSTTKTFSWQGSRRYDLTSVPFQTSLVEPYQHNPCERVPATATPRTVTAPKTLLPSSSTSPMPNTAIPTCQTTTAVNTSEEMASTAHRASSTYHLSSTKTANTGELQQQLPKYTYNLPVTAASTANKATTALLTSSYSTSHQQADPSPTINVGSSHHEDMVSAKGKGLSDY